MGDQNNYLTTEELLAGSNVTFDLKVPFEVMDPTSSDNGDHEPMAIKLRPLTLRAVQRVMKAAKDDDGLMSALMVKESLVEPELTYEQTMKLNSGLVKFMLAEVQRISGLKTEEDELRESVQAPMAKACFLLAKEFGWSPQQVAELTLGQILMYIEMIRQNRAEAKEAC